MPKDTNRLKAQETIDIIHQKGYCTTGETVNLSPVQPAKLVTSGELETICFPKAEGCPKLTLTANSAVDDILNAAQQNPGATIGVLNFASSLHPGGGFVNGAMAQEEALCQASTLYVQLEQCTELYELNRRQNSDTYTDHMAVSETEFFRNGRGVLIPHPVSVKVVTSAAVNNNKVRDQNSSRIQSVMKQRMHKIIQLFIREKCDILILGAFGCGVFKNDPSMVAQIWNDELLDYGGYFKKVIFSIMKGRNTTNYDAFQAVFATNPF